jgi:EPS-associated MarR family transcriptional regulator
MHVRYSGSVPKQQNQYQILKSLEKDPNYTQRQLSKDLNISLGNVNYCLKNLAEKGFVKINNFRKSKNRLQYSYLLTPKGIEEKAKLTMEFIKIKTQEYNRLKSEIKDLKSEAVGK